MTQADHRLPAHDTAVEEQPPQQPAKGPQLLDLALLKHVAGGNTEAPKGGWYEPNTEAAPKGGWH